MKIPLHRVVGIYKKSKNILFENNFAKSILYENKLDEKYLF